MPEWETVYEDGKVKLYHNGDGGNRPYMVEIDGHGRALSKRALYELAQAALSDLLAIDEGEARCSSEKCSKPVRWVVTEKNKKMTPVDPEPQTVISAQGEYRLGYVPHWATCADPDRFRK